LCLAAPDLSRVSCGGFVADGVQNSDGFQSTPFGDRFKFPQVAYGREVPRWLKSGAEARNLYGAVDGAPRFSPYLWRFSRLFPFFSLANTGKLESAIAIGEKDDDEIDLACRDWRLFGFKSISALAE
jgi:hypothetical protein